MKNNKGITLVTVIIMIIVMGIIASISVITSRDVLKKSKEQAKLQSKSAVEAAVSKYSARMATSGFLSPANQDFPGINNPSFKHTYEDGEGNIVEEEKHIGEDWYLLLEEHLEEIGVTYAKENYLVNYKDNVVIPLSNVGNVFNELAVHGYTDPGEENYYAEGSAVSGDIPSLEGTTKEFKWFIYNKKQLEFLRDFVNNGNTLTTAQRTLLESEGYNPDDVTMTEGTVVQLMANIDLGARPGTGSTPEEKWETTANENVKWTPIGTVERPLLGTFEGNHHTISGVYVNMNADYTGIFGNSKSIKNLTIKNSYIKGNAYTGGIVGLMDDTEHLEVVNCHNINTTVIGNGDRVGGVVGYFHRYGVIRECTNTGKILGDGKVVGGIAGFVSIGSEVSNCENNGEVVGKGERVGGIAGYINENTILKESTNTGNILGEGMHVGGIVGVTYTSSAVSNCQNNGDVTSKGERVGGIAGCINENAILKESTNTGKVSGDGRLVGGIVGFAYIGSEVSNCENNGEVVGKGERVGGIVGELDNTTQNKISNCANTGKVVGKGIYVGGIVGLMGQRSNISQATVENSYNKGEVEGVQYVGGIVGQLAGSSSKATVTNCYNKGRVTGSSYVGAIIGIEYPKSMTISTGNTLNKLFYLNTLGIKAISDEADSTTKKVQSVSEDINSYEQFITWIATQ